MRCAGHGCAQYLRYTRGPAGHPDLRPRLPQRNPRHLRPLPAHRRLRPVQTPPLSLKQALLLIGGETIETKVTHLSGYLASALKLDLEPEELIENLYLRTVCRPPSAEELSRWSAELKQATSLREAAEDPSVVSKMRQSNRGMLPPYVAILCRYDGRSGVLIERIPDAGLRPLGDSHAQQPAMGCLIRAGRPRCDPLVQRTEVLDIKGVTRLPNLQGQFVPRVRGPVNRRASAAAARIFRDSGHDLDRGPLDWHHRVGSTTSRDQLAETIPLVAGSHTGNPR